MTRRIGAHCSIAGGLHRAAELAIEIGANCFQIFTRSPRMWSAPPLAEADVERLRAMRREHDLAPLVVHGSYLLNLASCDEPTRLKSIRGFRDELERAAAVGADYLVIHPGSSKGQEVEPAIEILSRSFAAASAEIDLGGLEVLLENTAGGGASLGRHFGELAAIREAIHARTDAPIGFCIDTAHAFAMGFDVSAAAGLKETVARIEKAFGLDRVAVIHANDSKTALGSRVDRHERIGKGKIGRAAFERIINHPKLRPKAFILETPHGPDGTHRGDVRTLRSLLKRRSSGSPRRPARKGSS